MASPSSSAFAGYLLDRIRTDVQFLHSQHLLDAAESEAILSRLDGATRRANDFGNASAVDALTNQFGSTALVAQAAQQHQPPPPPMPARQNYASPPAQDNREKVKALWAYNGAQADDLTFQKNDVIVITQKENEHWYRGYVQSDPSTRTGLFPSNYVEPYRSDQAAPYPSQPQPHSYYASSPLGNEPEKSAMQPYQTHQPPQAHYYQPPPPPQQYYQPAPVAQAPSPSEPTKKNKFRMPGSGNGLGNTLAHAGVGGLGFGAGSAVASNIVNAIL